MQILMQRAHQRQLGMRTGNLYRQFDSLRYASRLEDKLIKALLTERKLSLVAARSFRYC